ncbi:MAG: DedA family protein [Proteobacteria bacterium]|nr:MAG: DedA family protein [Pseudomonadota bacterium]
MGILAQYLKEFIDIVLHLDQHLNDWIILFGPWIYVILFMVIFAETGLVVTPFLPGDSLLFALGALTVTQNAYLELPLLCIVLIAAAILGDAVNYSIGRYFGEKLFSNPNSRFFRREYLERTHRFYARHGGKTIILARFVPIVRTFAPFVAGMGKMKYRQFAFYNVAGGMVWVLSITILGAIFGDLPVVKQNFHLVVVGIIVISVIPIAIEFIKARREVKAGRL